MTEKQSIKKRILLNYEDSQVDNLSVKEIRQLVIEEKLTRLSSELVGDLLIENLVTHDPGDKAYADHQYYIAFAEISKFRFDKNKIDANSTLIKCLLAQLPDKFFSDKTINGAGGEGWVFLNACYNFEGEQWTSFHKSMNELFSIGMAAGYVTKLTEEMPMPAGMNYYLISDIRESRKALTYAQLMKQ